MTQQLHPRVADVFTVAEAQVGQRLATGGQRRRGIESSVSAVTSAPQVYILVTGYVAKTVHALCTYHVCMQRSYEPSPHREDLVSARRSTWWYMRCMLVGSGLQSPLRHAEQGHVADLDAVCQVELPHLGTGCPLDYVPHTGVRNSVRENPAINCTAHQMIVNASHSTHNKF